MFYGNEDFYKRESIIGEGDYIARFELVPVEEEAEEVLNEFLFAPKSKELKELKEKLKETCKKYTKDLNLKNLIQGGYNKDVPPKIAAEVKKLSKDSYVSAVIRTRHDYYDGSIWITYYTYDMHANLIYKNKLFACGFSYSTRGASLSYVSETKINYDNDLAIYVMGNIPMFRGKLTFNKAKIAIDDVGKDVILKLIKCINTKFKNKYIATGATGLSKFIGNDIMIKRIDDKK